MDQAQYKKADHSNKKLVLFSFDGPTKKSWPKRHNGKNATNFPIVYNNCIDLHSAGLVFLGCF
jgi:hypothetical protein